MQCMYVYIYTERERERHTHTQTHTNNIIALYRHTDTHIHNVRVCVRERRHTYISHTYEALYVRTYMQHACIHTYRGPNSYIELR